METQFTKEEARALSLELTNVLSTWGFALRREQRELLQRTIRFLELAQHSAPNGRPL